MKKVLIFLLVAGLVGGYTGYRMWNKPHQDIAAAKAEMAVEATALFAEFEKDEAAANAKYLTKGANGEDRVIALTGTVKSVEAAATTVVYLDAGGDNEVSAEMGSGTTCTLKAGDKASLKGTCTGKNLFTLEMKNCVEVK